MNEVVSDRKFSKRGKIAVDGTHNSGKEISRSGLSYESKDNELCSLHQIATYQLCGIRN